MRNDELQTALARLRSGSATSADLAALQSALAGGQISVVHGSGAIAQGQDATALGERAALVGSGAQNVTIQTGDGAVLFQGTDAVAIEQALERALQRISERVAEARLPQALHQLPAPPAVRVPVKANGSTGSAVRQVAY